MPVHHYRDCPQCTAPVILSPGTVACLRCSWSMTGGTFAQQAGALRAHPCPAWCTHPGTWFDRAVCAEPCGSMHDRCADCGVVVGHPCPFGEHQLGPEETSVPHTCHHPGREGPGSAHHTLSRGLPLCSADRCPGAGREVAGLCPDDSPGCLYYGGCVRTAVMPPETWHRQHLARYAALPPEAMVPVPTVTGRAVDACRKPSWWQRTAAWIRAAVGHGELSDSDRPD
ncbi:hypothetical protein [Streptomyces termitum]|uniref:hypothetical protein n=1 Tax=Streptomyces termitum TaxID=67368 RepID=UPI0033B86BDF